MIDYIRLPRSALSDELWRNKDFGCLLWYLLSKADERGIATFTAADIELRLGIPRQRLRTMLSKMQKSGLATNCQPTSNQQATNVTFDFQRITPVNQPTANQLPTNCQPTKTSRKTTKFTPPTDEEVAAYVAEKSYHFNPAQFVPHYQSKGWKVGNQPMKDWRAACRTWENSWKEKHGERFYHEIQPIITTDNAASRKAQRDRGLSLATEIVARSENLLNLYNGGGTDPHACQD
jgi:hypothetical protein